jgi:MscS family membrane protein
MTPIPDRILDWVGWPERWPREWPAAVLRALFVLVVTLFVARLLLRVVARLLRQATARTATDVDDRLLELVDRPIRRIILLGGVYWALAFLPLGGAFRRITTGVVYVVAVFLAVRMLTAVALLLVQAFGRRFQDPRDRVAFEKDYLPVLSKVLGIVLAIIGLISVLHHFGQEISSLVAALGIGGIAVGFAAKDTLGNMIAGFTILADRPFRPGDRIKLATGEIGDVLEIGTRSTRLKLVDSNLLVVPNTELVNSRVMNFNFPNVFTRGQLDVGVAYGSDIERAKTLVREVIVGQPEVAREPPPFVMLAGFGDSALLITAWYHVTDFTTLMTVNDRVRVQTYERLRKEGIAIPPPQREVRIVQG